MMQIWKHCLCWVAILLVFSFKLLAQTPDFPINNTVILHDKEQLLPIKQLYKEALPVIYAQQCCFHEAFLAMASRYTPLQKVGLQASHFTENLRLSLEKLKNPPLVLVILPSQYLQNPLTVNWLRQYAKQNPLILMVVGEGSALRHLDFVNFPVVWVPSCRAEELENAAMTLFGGLATYAKLDRTYGVTFVKGLGQQTSESRLSYRLSAHQLKLKSLMQQKMRPIFEEAIREKATPGGVVMVVHRGEVLLEEAFGHTTYDKRTPTQKCQIFDLASVSKIVATTPQMMRLYERGQIHLDSTLGHYWDLSAYPDKASLTIRQLLLHEAGLVPFIPFHTTIATGELQRQASDTHRLQIAQNAFIRPDFYQRVMLPVMLSSPLKSQNQYVYSDLSMYFLQEAGQRVSGQTLASYVQEEFYQPLGMQTAGYLPLKRFSRDMLIPTEWDKDFRMSLLQGDVHDQGAALAGGVAGHAGVFSSANDLAIFGQLMLNRGEYGQQRYFQASTIDLFTSNQSKYSRRGLGFDRKDPDPKREYPSKFASSATFGHTGYTGTCIWIDPKNQLIFIFLSNRVHPQVSNKLNDLSIRGRLMDVVYEVIR
jgi:CubicO group peptidase (beta-lactamase class C family)